MYGLPKDKDLGFLVGRELVQVCIGLHQTVLAFDQDTSISVECEFEILDRTGDRSSDKARFLALLASHIATVENRGAGELVLCFSDGASVRIRDSNPNYESYQISA